MYLYFHADSEGIIVHNISTPLPTITITGSPINSHYFSGLQLNLTCHIQLSMSRDYYKVRVSSRWSKSGTLLTSNDQVSVNERAEEVGPLRYESRLMFTSLDGTRGDNGDYTCSVTVSPVDVPHLHPVTATATHTVSVECKNFLDY